MRRAPRRFYAMKLACDRLHDGSVDAMLAGAVNRADDLFIHVGFTALNALSPSGRSRPFQRDADGLVPAEGAALVLLKRLPDAVRDDDQILGVIRSIGLSNDGRGAGMLAPSEEGQKRALRLAYEAAGLRPMDISLIECHGTGTPVGDGVELRSTGAIYDGLRDVPIGSIKSNLGHLITVAGAAGLLKVLSALEARTRPPTIGTDAPLLELEGSPFRLLTKAEPWEASPPRRAALSAFGFGGNNAHVIVEEWCEGAEPIASVASTRVPAAAEATPTIAIVGVGVRAADATSADQLFDRWVSAETSLTEDANGVRAGFAPHWHSRPQGFAFPRQISSRHSRSSCSCCRPHETPSKVWHRCPGSARPCSPGCSATRRWPATARDGERASGWSARLRTTPSRPSRTRLCRHSRLPA